MNINHCSVTLSLGRTCYCTLPKLYCGFSKITNVIPGGNVTEIAYEIVRVSRKSVTLYIAY